MLKISLIPIFYLFSGFYIKILSFNTSFTLIMASRPTDNARYYVIHIIFNTNL